MLHAAFAPHPGPRVRVSAVSVRRVEESSRCIGRFCRAGKPLKGATCGGEKVGDTRFEVGGKWASRKIVASYKAGATIKTKVHIAVNHWCAGGLDKV